ncbi:MAG: RimK family protein [Alphaproteobacteria bacterium]
MTDHIVIVENKADRDWAASAGTAVTAREFATNPERFKNRQARVINLSASFDYLDLGYYCSLLAEARGQKVVPTVETLLNLSRKTLYAVDLPELNAALREEIGKLAAPPRAAFTLTVCFGQPTDSRFRNFARRLFDRFRSPLLRVQIVHDERWQVRQIEHVAASALSPDEFEFFVTTLERYTRADWRPAKAKSQPRYWIAVLHDPAEKMPPSSPETLKKFVSAGAGMGIAVELIQRKDFLKLAEYEALFIRETTSIENHTFRFARKGVHEGLVVVDDPVSILRCTNKVYLAELLQANRLPAPRTLVLDRESILQAEEQIGYPVVLKIPDGSFSRGVIKANNRAELMEGARKLLQRTELILAQQFMYTAFDWRVGILNRQPIFVSQYFMSRKHWQIVNHRADGRIAEGGFKTWDVAAAPKEVVDVALKAANLIGDGLYGVDLKQTDAGVFVIEINDNPNIDRGVEDAMLKDDLYRTVLRDFVRRIEAR